MKLYKSGQDEEGVLPELLAMKLNTSSMPSSKGKNKRVTRDTHTPAGRVEAGKHSYLPVPTAARHG